MAPVDEDLEEPEQPAMLEQALEEYRPIRPRAVPVRVVQFTRSGSPFLSDTIVRRELERVNTLLERTRLVFYLVANHDEPNTPFSDLFSEDGADDIYTWPTNLSAAPPIRSWNPNCTFPVPSNRRESEYDALQRAAAYCAYDEEVLIYVNAGPSMGGQPPWNSRVIGMSRYHMDGRRQNTLAHEFGHYLGLPHTFPGAPDGVYGREWGLTAGQNSTRANWNALDPETGERTSLANYWDLVYVPRILLGTRTIHPTSREEALQYEGLLRPKDWGWQEDGSHGSLYRCTGPGDPICGNRPAETLRMDLGISNVYYSDTHPSLFEALDFETPWGVGPNLMSYGYGGLESDPFAARISWSQVAQIQRALRYDIAFNVEPGAGTVWGRRPLIGYLWAPYQEGYYREVGFDRVGDDYDSFPIHGDKPDLCRNACLQESRCRAYTYVANDDGNGNGRCWLKSGLGTFVVNPSTISGSVSIYDKGIDRAGNDLRSHELAAPLPELCAQSCAEEPRCVAYTYVKPGVQGSKARCWLKSSVGVRATNPDTVSGVKRDLSGVDLVGNDYRNFVPSPATAATCQEECRMDSRCRAYTFVGSTNRCWLKTKPGTPTARSGAVSGIKDGFSEHTDMPSITPYASFERSGATACQASCLQDPRCRAFTHTRYDFRTWRGQCDLRDEVGESVFAVGVVSGIKGLEFM
ncbi:MAG: PAN domain-containing protein [Pseudomonadota bacterium]